MIDPSSNPGPERPPSAVGRLIAYLLFGIPVVWVAGALLYGFLGELYGDPPDPSSGAAMQAWCVGRLGGLRAELEERAAAAVSVGLGGDSDPLAVGETGPLAEWRVWLGGWRRGLEGAQVACGAEPAAAALSELSKMAAEISGGVELIFAARRDRGGRIDAVIEESLAAE